MRPLWGRAVRLRLAVILGWKSFHRERNAVGLMPGSLIRNGVMDRPLVELVRRLGWEGEMKIRVVYENGRTEEISLTGTVLVREGFNLDRLAGQTGEYFFTKDGFYDGSDLARLENSHSKMAQNWRSG